MKSWFRINSPRIKNTMLFFYAGLDPASFKELVGYRSFDIRFGAYLTAAWDGEFGGPDLQLWVNLGLISISFGIETNPYIKKGFESGR